MRKIGTIILFVVLVAVFLWLQQSIVEHRANYRIDEKILLVSDNPKVTKIGALGFDNLLADFGWIRAIQYFGGNFTTLNKQNKREGFVRLMENIVTLDPHFVPAWKFGGFAFHESVKDASMAIDFMMRGAKINPTAWELPFDSGFISYYQLGDTTRAKDYFEQAYSRSEFKAGNLLQVTFKNNSDTEGPIQIVQNPQTKNYGDLIGLVGSIPHEFVPAGEKIEGTTTFLTSELTKQANKTTLDVEIFNNTKKYRRVRCPCRLRRVGVQIRQRGSLRQIRGWNFRCSDCW